MCAYEGSGLEQLTIEPGQLIHVLNKRPSGWWEGELQVCLHSVVCDVYLCRICNLCTVRYWAEYVLCHHHHHHIRLLNNRQNAVAQREMRGVKITYKS